MQIFRKLFDPIRNTSHQTFVFKSASVDDTQFLTKSDIHTYIFTTNVVGLGTQYLFDKVVSKTIKTS